MTALEITLTQEIEVLKARVGRLEALAGPERREAGSNEQGARGEEKGAATATPAPTGPRLPPWLIGISDEDRAKLRCQIEAERKALGLPTGPPTMSAKEVRDLMVREGLRPEDRVANTILAEMRGYKPGYEE